MPRPYHERERLAITAVVWGFAEATLFFIVPDVLLTWLALHDRRGAWRACVWALAGALLGGAVMYAWGTHAPASAGAALVRVPAINATMVETVRRELDKGALAVARGPIYGVPYKIYAMQAGASGMSLWPFLAISVPTRLVRFVAITGMTVLACHTFARLPLRSRRAIHVGLWTAFYAWYFWRFSGKA